MKLELVYDYGDKKDKKIRIENCLSELHAKMRLNEYLVKKQGRKRLVVKSCVEYNMFNGLFDKIWNGEM